MRNFRWNKSYVSIIMDFPRSWMPTSMLSKGNSWPKSDAATRWNESFATSRLKSIRIEWGCLKARKFQRLPIPGRSQTWRYVSGVVRKGWSQRIWCCFWFQSKLEKTENEMRELSKNAVNLHNNYLELTELKHVLEKTQVFFTEVSQ